MASAFHTVLRAELASALCNSIITGQCCKSLRKDGNVTGDGVFISLPAYQYLFCRRSCVMSSVVARLKSLPPSPAQINAVQ